LESVAGRTIHAKRGLVFGGGVLVPPESRPTQAHGRMYAAGVFPVRARCGRLWSSTAGGLRCAPPGGFRVRVGGWEKEVVAEGLAAPPHPPQGGEDLALGVEAGVAHVVGAGLALPVEALHGVVAGGAFAGGAPGVVAQGFRVHGGRGVRALVTQRLAVAAPVGDRQAGVFDELLRGGEAGRILDDGAESSGAR